MLKGSVWWHKLIRHLASVIDVYDSMNAVMSLGIDRRVRERLVEELVEVCGRPRRVVDVGCGPGTLLEYLVRRASHVIAVDPLQPMLCEVRRRLHKYRHLIDCVVAVGEHLPIRDEGVDLVTAAFSLRDFIDWVRGVEEFSRISRRCYAVLDIAKRRGIALVAQLLWWGLVVPLAALAYRKNPSHYIALARTIVRWRTPEEIAKVASRYAVSVRLERIAGGFAFKLLACTRRDDCSSERRKRGEVRATTIRGVERPRGDERSLH